MSRDICERHSTECQNSNVLRRLGSLSSSSPFSSFLPFVFVLSGPFLFVVFFSPSRRRPPSNTSQARADQSHLLRRSVTEHVTPFHLVRVPTASRCQPRRSGTGRDACPPIVYPNETKRSNRTGRPDASTVRARLLRLLSQFRASPGRALG